MIIEKYIPGDPNKSLCSSLQAEIKLLNGIFCYIYISLPIYKQFLFYKQKWQIINCHNARQRRDYYSKNLKILNISSYKERFKLVLRC